MARIETAQTGERAWEPEASAAEPGHSSPWPLTGKAPSVAARKGTKCEHPCQSHPKLVTNLYHWIANTGFKLFCAKIHFRLQLECWKGQKRVSWYSFVNHKLQIKVFNEQAKITTPEHQQSSLLDVPSLLAHY